MKYNSKMLIDEIMDQIETKTGVPKKQQRITHQSKQLTRRQTPKYHNIQEDDTMDPSLELHGRTDTTESTEQPAVDTEELATHNDAPNTERKPPKRRASEAGCDVPESADVDARIEQLKKKDMERITRQNHEEVMTLAKQNTDKLRHHRALRCQRRDKKTMRDSHG